MSLNTAEKAEIIKAHQRASNDTGSSEVQISLLSARIEYLTEHLKIHTHDVHTRYGLTRLVSRRRRLLNYLKKENHKLYRELIEKLNIRG